LLPEEGRELGQSLGAGSTDLVLNLEQDSEGVELIGGQGDLVVVDVCRDEPQEKLKIRLHKEQDYLVVVVHVGYLGNFGPGRGP